MEGASSREDFWLEDRRREVEREREREGERGREELGGANVNG